MLAFMGTYEWLILLAIMLLLFGKRLPEVMRSLGRGAKEFKKGLGELDEGAPAAGGTRQSGGEGDASPPAG